MEMANFGEDVAEGVGGAASENDADASPFDTPVEAIKVENELDYISNV